MPDDLKAGVNHPCRYDPEINRTYQEIAEHYGVAVVPARVKHLRDKSKVEVGVQNVERWVLAKLCNETFFNQNDHNLAIRKLLDELNQRKMKHLGKSRRELYEWVDRPALLQLPATPYEFAEWKKATMNIEYHIKYDDHFYSLLSHLYPSEVWVRATEKNH